MRILLILPPFERLYGIGRGYFPIGLGYLAACLEKGGFDVQIYNAEMGEEKRLEQLKYSKYDNYYQNYRNRLVDDGHFIWQEVRYMLRKAAPDVIGLSVMTAKYGSAKKITDIAKEISPSTIVIWGGPHPTIQPEEVLRGANVEFVVRGEGEKTLLELCQVLEDGSNEFSHINGLSYKSEGGIFHNVDRDFITDLDSLPFPARHLDVRPDLYSPDQMAVLVSTRGCPFNCGYCGAKSIWRRRVRHRGPENILAEIDLIVSRYDVNRIFFWDDNFTVSRSRTLDLCNKLIQSKRKITFGMTTRVDLLDEELLSVMKQAGLESIDLGIETGSPRMLKLVRKEITHKQVMSAVELCRKLDINWDAFIMVGFPEETEEDIDMTAHLIGKIKPFYTCLSIFTPYPGTELYDKAKELGLIPHSVNWTYYSHQSPENHFMKYIEKERFREIIVELATKIDRRNWVNLWKRRMTSAVKHPLATLHKIWKLLKVGDYITGALRELLKTYSSLGGI